MIARALVSFYSAGDVPLPLLLLYANTISSMAMVVANAAHVNSIVMILACCFLFINNFVLYPIDSMLFNKNQTTR